VYDAPYIDKREGKGNKAQAVRREKRELIDCCGGIAYTDDTRAAPLHEKNVPCGIRTLYSPFLLASTVYHIL